MSTSPFPTVDTFVQEYFFRIVLPAMVLLANFFYGSTETGVSGMVKRWVEGNSERLAYCKANLRPANEPFGILKENDIPLFGIWLSTFYHHLIGATLAFIGWYYSSTGFIRLGLALEIGENVLHYAQMIVCKFITSWGPWEMAPNLIWVMLSLHHSLGLLAGTMGHFVLAEYTDFQLLVFVLLAIDLPNIFNYNLFPFGDTTKVGTWAFYTNLLVMTVFWPLCVYVRFPLYIPTAYSLYSKVWENYGPMAGRFIAVPASLFSGFAVLMALASVASLIEAWQAVFKPVEEQKHAIGRANSFRGLGKLTSSKQVESKSQ